MREELSSVGVIELRTAKEVEAAFTDNDTYTMLLIVNSVCGCAAANARPAVRLSLQSEVLPDTMATVFAGQDLEATARARQYLVGVPPSSPFMALIKDGEPVFVLERRDIEGRSASAIAMDLVGAYQKFCSNGSGSAPGPEGPEEVSSHSNDLPDTFRSIL